jgi:dTDP-4-dehydrorhamnose reductase
MRILVIGSTGQLGWELQRSLLPVGEVIPVDYPEIDLTDQGSIEDWVRSEKPDVIINAAAYTAVDQAEKEFELARNINSTAPGILAKEALAAKSLLIHFSTGFVFDGRKGDLYQETDSPNPINVYGETKLAGEGAVQQVGGEYYIFRTSWVYSTRRDCFLTKVLQWSRTRETLKIVSDQTGSPTWSRTLADTTAQALVVMETKGKTWRVNHSGIYHLAGNGSVNRFDWATNILELDPRPDEQVVTSIQPAKSIDFKTAARRPENSALDCTHFQETFNLFKSDWLTSLKMAMSSFYQST